MEKGAIEPGAELDHHCSKPQQQSQLCFHNNDHSKHDLLEMKHHSQDEQSSDDENLHSSAGGQQQVEVAAAPRKLKLPYRRNSSSFPSGTLLHRHNCPQAPTISLAAHASDLHTGGPNPSQQQKPLATPTASTDDQKMISINPVLEEKVIPKKKKITTLISSGINANPRRVCKFCDREFPSGRALGGHMRVHGALATDSLLTDVEPEKRQLDAFITRSSSPIANSRKDRLEELKCMISGSQLLNSRRRSLIRRRINSEESMVRGFDDEGKSVVGGINEEKLAMREIPVAEEEQLVKRGEKLVRAKEQLVKRGIPAEEESTLVKGRSLEVSFCQDQEFFSDDVDDDESFGLHSSELMALGNGVELPVADHNGMVSSASESVSDKGIPLYKLRRNPKPNRRLWTDQEDFSIHQAALLANQSIDNHQSSTNNHSFARGLSSPPPLRVGLAERARPCSECGKVFWSWKALFGHMRCHPEREWRGIQRPEVSSSEPEKQFRAGKKLNSLAEHGIAGNAELETKLELEAQNREESKQIEEALRISTPANEENLTMKEEREAKESQRSRKEEEKDFNEVEEFPMVMTQKETKRSAKPALLRGLTDDLTPSAWPTRKRSRRIKDFQLTTTTSEPALTSETATSSELRDKPKFVVEDREDLDMANCLVFLSNAGNQMQDMEKHFMETTQESSFRKYGSPTALEYSKQPDGSGEVATLHNNGNDDNANDDDDDDEENHAVLATRPNGDGVKYECSTCKRCFNSHQALGGHRASHRKTKGCFARTNYVAEEVHESGENSITEDEFFSPVLDKWQIMRHAVGAPPLHHQQEEKVPTVILPSITERSPANNKKKRFKGHECSICHRIFLSGQALGGHKRCHWTGEKIADTVSVASSSNNNNMASLLEQAEWGGGGNNAGEAKKVKEDAIDLNLPAPLDEENEIDYNNVGFSSTEAADPVVCGRLVHAAEGEQIVGSLMDCPGSRSSLNGLSRDWIAEDLLGADGRSRRGSWVQANRELEARCRYDGRTATGVWSQQWTSAAAAWKDS